MANDSIMERWVIFARPLGQHSIYEAISLLSISQYVFVIPMFVLVGVNVGVPLLLLKGTFDKIYK